jgi:hypothetical protein
MNYFANNIFPVLLKIKFTVNMCMFILHHFKLSTFIKVTR